MKTACWRRLGGLAVVVLVFAYAAEAAPCDPTAGKVKLYCQSTSPRCRNEIAAVIANVTADVNSRSATNGNMKLCFGQDPPDVATGVILDTDPAWNSSASFAELNLYMLIRMTYVDFYPPPFTAGQGVILTNALASGTLKKLMIYDFGAAYFNHQANYPGIDISRCSGGQPEEAYYDIVGLQSAFTTADPNLTESGFPVTTLGAEYGSVQGATFSSGLKALGHCALNAVANATTCDPVVYFEAYNGVAVLPVGFTYCLGSGVVFYSTQPLDYYAVFNPGYAYFNIFESTLSTLLGPAPVVREPVCPANVFVSRAWLPPNGKMTQVDITAVSYPNGTVPAEDTINITAVDFADTTQGAQPTYPLAEYITDAQNPATVTLRAERNGNGPGRVYRIKYTATTQQSGMPPESCDGQAYVCIPHDASVADATTITMICSAHENKLCPDPQSITTWMSTTGPAIARRFGKP